MTKENIDSRLHAKHFIDKLNEASERHNIKYENIEIMNSRRINSIEGSVRCASGHVGNFPPICGADGCLRTLVRQASGSNMKDSFQHKHNLDFVNRIAGWCDAQTHAPLARDLSVMQWDHGVVGSVGEIGVYMGKYSSILGFVTNTAIGERFFAADIFENKTRVSQEQGRQLTYINTMKHVGFSPNSADPTKKLYLFSDSSMYLSKLLFLRWNLPAVRMFSIDGGHLRPIVLNDFEKAACVMREGGIIIFDDPFNTHAEVRQAIVDFYDYYGSKAYKPLIYISNKLFICTSDFHTRYMTYIRKHMTTKYKLKEKVDTIFGREGYRYFSRT